MLRERERGPWRDLRPDRLSDVGLAPKTVATFGTSSTHSGPGGHLPTQGIDRPVAVMILAPYPFATPCRPSSTV